MQRIHLYPPERILAPRGPLEKESLSLVIVDAMTDEFEHWTDPEYADALTTNQACDLVLRRAREEFGAACSAFVKGRVGDW